MALLENNLYERAIEIGCGEGSILEILSNYNNFRELYGIEISESAISKVNDKKINKLVEIKLFDGYHIPYPDKFFDIAICSHVMEHVEHERQLLREIKRISKIQVFEVPIDFSLQVDKKVKHFMSYGHINIYTPATFKFLLLTEKFEIKKEKYSMYPLNLLNLKNMSIFKKAITVIKYYIIKLIPTLRKIKPNTYTVMTH